MRFDAQSPKAWQQINEQLRKSLGCNSKVYIYRGLHHALFETCLGLHLRFGHKRRIVAEIGLGDHLQQLEIELAKLGVRIKNEFTDDMKKEGKECLAYLHDLDDSLTAELYDHIETVKKVSETNMYKIHVAHHLFHVRKGFVKNLGEYDIIVASLSPDYCLVFAGDKVNLPVLVAGQLNWRMEVDLKNIAQLILEKNKLYQPEIAAFEESMPPEVKPWFESKTPKRIYDRAVLILNEHDGAAMQDLLIKELNLEKYIPGEHNSIEVASLCRWQNDIWFKQAKTIGRTTNDMQGMIAIDGSLVNAQFKAKFFECLETLKQLSS